MTLEKVRSRAALLLFALSFNAQSARASDASAAPGVFYLSSGRLGAIAAVSIGVVGVVSGVRAFIAAGRAGTTNVERRPNAALAAGVIAIALGGLVAVTAPAGVGTGNGFGGAVVGVAVGLISSVLGVLAARRVRR